MLHPLQGIGSMKPGDVAIIFTPDDTHFKIASIALSAGLHVLVAKPIVKTLREHIELVKLAKKHNVLVRMDIIAGDCHLECLLLEVCTLPMYVDRAFVYKYMFAGIMELAANA